MKDWLNSNQSEFFSRSTLLHSGSIRLRAKMDTVPGGLSNAIDLKSGTRLFRQNDPIAMFYLIINGWFKTSSVNKDGYESIHGFYFTNDFIGLDSLGHRYALNTAEAITPSTVYGIPFPFQKNHVFKTPPELEHYIYDLMGLEITAVHDHLLAHRLCKADQKLAVFLLQESMRNGSAPATQLNMPMARQDLANYLGISPETLSRLFSRFEAHGLVLATPKHVEILDLEGLASLLPDDL